MLPVIENLPAHAEDIKDVGLIPGLGRSPEVGNGSPLQYSGLETRSDRGSWPRSHIHTRLSVHVYDMHRHVG